MDAYDFSVLEAKFPDIVEKMANNKFSSHEFILKLSQAYQIEYIDALYHYRSIGGSATPFQVVHGILMKKLAERKELVTMLERNYKDPNIFGYEGGNAYWKKVDSTQV